MITPLTGLLIALALATSPGPEARSAPLDDVFVFWSDYQAMAADERDAFDLSYTLDAPLRGDGQAYRFWVEEDAESFTELDATGPITPPNTDAFERGYRLFTDAPRGAVRVEMRLTLPAPTRTDYDMAELEAALAQAGNAMRRSMGLRALFMPRLDTVRFAFDGPAPEAVFVLDDGTTRSIDAVFSSDVLVTPGEDESDGAQAIRFDTAPLYAVLETRR